MANTLAQSDSELSLMEMTFPAKTTINRKSDVSTLRIHLENTNVNLVEPLRRLSDLVDGFVRLSSTSQLPVSEPENSNQWDIFECANAILSIVGARGGAQFERPSPICYRKSSHQTTPTDPCIGVRSSLLTESYCSQAETW
jgi:hypothetical protein